MTLIYLKVQPAIHIGFFCSAGKGLYPKTRRLVVWITLNIGII
jgi:hypothetical protein